LQNDPVEYPLGIHLWPAEKRSARKRPRQGYHFSLLENSSDSFRFTAVVNACKVPVLFRDLASLLPEESFLILEFYQEGSGNEKDANPLPAVYYSPYMPTTEILEALAPFLPRLIHDGFVGFGLANNRNGMEIFFSEEKVLTCFTGNHIRVMDLFGRHSLPHHAELVYPTDFGHDHLSLLCHGREALPEPFASMSDTDLDYTHFCAELAECLDMYPVEESLSFFLSKKEQDAIETRIKTHPDFEEFSEEDFGTLLLDWNDFVNECEAVFEGDLWEYLEGLRLRDLIQYVLEGVSAELRKKILEIVTDADAKFQKNLVDRRKRLDHPADIPLREDRFWYRGMVRNQGTYLRRDLIREGWYKA